MATKLNIILYNKLLVILIINKLVLVSENIESFFILKKIDLILSKFCKKLYCAIFTLVFKSFFAVVNINETKTM